MNIDIFRGSCSVIFIYTSLFDYGQFLRKTSVPYEYNSSLYVEHILEGLCHPAKQLHVESVYPYTQNEAFANDMSQHESLSAWIKTKVLQ